jgi:hypothetical protein
MVASGPNQILVSNGSSQISKKFNLGCSTILLDMTVKKCFALINDKNTQAGQ